MNIIIENVRSLIGYHSVQIKPLTILTGENSSGKSTFLSVISALSNTINFPLSVNFNESPYELGSFDTIASFKRRTKNEKKSFTIGFSTKIRQTTHQVKATFTDRYGQPELDELSISNEKIGKVRLRFRSKDNIEGEIKIFSSKESKKETNIKIDQSLRIKTKDFSQLLLYLVLENKGVDTTSNIQELMLLATEIVPFTALSLAPIRTKPSRTYDRFIDKFSPEGNHIPYTIARIYYEETLIAQRKQLFNALEKFGKNAGLYNKLIPKRLGKKASDPFQLGVYISGRPVNLLDVGYGVSQSLPILVQSIQTNGYDYLIMQQPEVHLHPRAQAALGTFFAESVANSKRKFIIETHSDYIIDRIRMEIAKGTIRYQDISLLHFDKPKSKTTIHQLSFDKLGNVQNAPPAYRNFFLREEMELLSRGEK